MTKEELTRYDGRDGRRAYVAVNGKVYDFTDSRLWREGNHATQHQAGCDLTAELAQAPHVRAVIERFRVVDDLVVPSADGRKKPWGIVVAIFLTLLAIVFYFL